MLILLLIQQVISEMEEGRTKHSKKVVDEADRLRRKAELEELLKEEEESNNREY
jgi:hypothetical protein